MGETDTIEQVLGENDDKTAVLSVRAQRQAAPLYTSRIKVHPQKISGPFRRIKWAVLAFCLTIYYLAPWLRWDRGPFAPHQALLIDMPGRRAYFFWIEIWPQEVYFLTGLLIIAAIGLFFVTSMLGRVWCGYACPQTVWTDLFMLVERWIEGDRNARIKLDKAPPGVNKFAKRVAKHAAWLLIALLTGGAWVFYFQDAPTALRNIVTGAASVQTYFFVGLFTTTTYLLAGWAREQVCTYMCPWPRFQSAMLDEQSLIVTYEAWRGEPRGKLKGSSAERTLGDCIDCMKCVAVCPTGIDIRDGQQLECIGCGLCIDACNTVMPLIGRPRNLIAFDTLANQAAKSAGGKGVYHLVRTRTIVYVVLLLLVSAIMAVALLMRSHVEVDVLHERNPLFVTLSGGAIRNGYTVRILNKTHDKRDFDLTIRGLGRYAVAVVGAKDTGDETHALMVTTPPDGVETYRLYVTAKPDLRSRDSGEDHRLDETDIAIEAIDRQSGEHASHHSIFITPPSKTARH